MKRSVGRGVHTDAPFVDSIMSRNVELSLESRDPCPEKVCADSLRSDCPPSDCGALDGVLQEPLLGNSLSSNPLSRAILSDCRANRSSLANYFDRKW